MDGKRGLTTAGGSQCASTPAGATGFRKPPTPSMMPMPEVPNYLSYAILVRGVATVFYPATSSHRALG